jgi:hypothetical protein
MTYWQAKDEGREYGPFATLLEAMQSMQADDGTPELNEARRAQLGPDEEKRCTGRKSDASVEDPHWRIEARDRFFRTGPTAWTCCAPASGSRAAAGWRRRTC